MQENAGKRRMMSENGEKYRKKNDVGKYTKYTRETQEKGE